MQEKEIESRTLLELRKLEIDTLEEKILKLSKEVKEKDNLIKGLQHEIKEKDKILRKFFSPRQLDRLLKQKKTQWHKDDIADAISLRGIATKAYLYLKEIKEFPYPSLATLKRWSAKFKLKPGLDNSAILLMKAWGETLSERERLTVLTFDETYLSEDIAYDPSGDKIVGGKTVQVVMARGLTGNWKQPIYFDFDQEMTRHIFESLVKELYQAGFIVVAATSDMGSTNRGFWTDMGINVKKTWLSHCCNENLKIFIFADVPHLIKLLRNHFLDQGFLFPWLQKFISRKALDELLTVSSSSDLKIAHKLTKQMLDVQGSARQRVSPATKLFSRKMANALALSGLRGHIKHSNYEYLSAFIRLVNNWFDLHNSVSLFGKHEGVNAYCGSDGQKKILDDMTLVMKNMRVEPHQSCLPFQNGIIISNESLKGLYDYVRSTYGVQYIITRRLNQDILESFFGYIRSMGRAYDHPSALQFIYRMRLYILSKHSSTVFSQKTNCQQEKLPDVTTVTAMWDHERGEKCDDDFESDELDVFPDIVPSSDLMHKAFEDDPLTENEIREEEDSEIQLSIMDVPEDMFLDFDLLEDFEKKQVF